jgi:hypothetical protein
MSSEGAAPSKNGSNLSLFLACSKARDSNPDSKDVVVGLGRFRCSSSAVISVYDNCFRATGPASLFRCPPSPSSRHQQFGVSIGMLSRLSALSRQLSRPVPTNPQQFHFGSVRPLVNMTNQTKFISTAGCLIIGDEVLGGKVNGTGFSERGRS